MFNRSERREEAAQELAKHQSETAFLEEIGQLYRRLVAGLWDLRGVTGPQVVAGIGPKGRPERTPVTTVVSYLLLQVVSGDLAPSIDFWNIGRTRPVPAAPTRLACRMTAGLMIGAAGVWLWPR